MPHVTFVHGIANKPPPDVLIENWLAALADGGLDLDASGVSSSMVYWADVVYAEPLSPAVDFESVDDELATRPQDADLSWLEHLPPQERAFAEALIDTYGIERAPPDGDPEARPAPPSEAHGSAPFEAVPLPWFIKSRFMRRFLKDVHHYLFDARYSPRPGETFQVQGEIRERFVGTLRDDLERFDGPHIVLAHSMGTVISYDCLKNVPGCPAIDGYVTVGSPLGISEIHDNFSPRHDRQEAFPSETLKADWINVYDRLDPVAFDARIANDYRRAGEDVVQDERVRNGGLWRHSSTKYYAQPVLQSHLRRLLRLD